MMAYANMFKRDVSRLEDCLERLDECPLGAGALAGTTYPADRFEMWMSSLSAENSTAPASMSARMAFKPSTIFSGTTYPADRFETARALGFKKPTDNSMDSVSDRDAVGGVDKAASGRLGHVLRPDGEGVQHGAEDGQAHLHRVDGVEEGLLVLLGVLVPPGRAWRSRSA